ncbi:MAG TPA: hypothetical protein VG796_22740 [Verrucomicrobiales bacterium]|jgi:hypothetical protein|nr:hypothetical protein [Verrucomicrobiales bacterium]
MAIRLEKAIVRGEISNETPGFVTGRIWLLGLAAPLVLNLKGNCLRDIAGCTLSFINPHPKREPLLDILAEVQDGSVGDMTASRKSRVPTVTDEQLLSLLDEKQPVPTKLANCLYLEWFSEVNGRVVIESHEFALQISAPAWTMTAEEETAQSLESQENFHDYLDGITGMDAGDDEDEEMFDEEEEEDQESFDSKAEGEGEGDPAFFNENEGQPLNEFQWEQELRDADRRAEAYQEAFDRYKDHPDRERLIAEAMGWDPEEVDELTDELSEVSANMQPEDPQSLIENANSIAGDDEESHHPLCRRAMNFALNLQREAEARGLLDPDAARDSPVLTVIVSIIALGGKLAAALDPMSEGLDPEPGFVIAMLKRAQIPLNEALHALSSVDMARLSRETRGWLTQIRGELFDLRNDILDLMKELRMRQ